MYCVALMASMLKPSFTSAEEPYQILRAMDKEPYLVYEVVLRPGTIYYDETGNDRVKTEVARVGSTPYLGFWRSEAHRGERLFGATSRSGAFSEAFFLRQGGAAAWTFRKKADHSLSAVVLGLRSANAPVARATSTSARRIKVSIPAHTRVNAAVMFRRNCEGVRIDMGSIWLMGGDENAGYFNVAENSADQASEIRSVAQKMSSFTGFPLVA